MTPENPVSQIETSTQKVEQTIKTPEQKLTPEQLEQRVLEEALELSWLTKEDLEQFYKNCSSCILQTLREELQTTPEQILIEQKVKELYKEYVEKGLKEWKAEVVSLDALTKSIDSPRIDDLKKEFEKIINPILDKYDYLDIQTKDFIKIWMINSILKSPVWEIWESLIWWIWIYIQKLSNIDPENLSSLWEAFKENPKDSWRTLTLEEKFWEILWNYTKKFDEIQEKLKTNPSLTPEQKQNIISHIDWFRNPALVETGINWLDVSKIDVTKTTKNKNPLDTKAISEYMVNSREKILDLSKKLNLWDKAWDTIYGLMEGWGMVWEWVQKIIEVILKIPFIGKFFAMFLWLNPDPKKAIEELRENASNFKYISSLKSLWVSKDKEWKTIEWKEPFKNIDLSEVNFNSVKNEIKEVKAIFWETKDEDLSSKWQSAFTNWYIKDDITLKFDLWNKKEWKLSSQEFKKILNDWLEKFNKDKENKKAKEETEKRETELKEKTEQISQIDTDKNALQLLSWVTINWLSDTAWMWDYNDFKNIKFAEISWNTDVDIVLKKAIWEWWQAWIISHESDYDKLSDNVRKVLKKAIEFIKEFINTWENKKLFYSQTTISNIINNSQFKEFIESKKTQKETELKWLISAQEKHGFANLVWTEIWRINSETKLSKWITVLEKNINLENGHLSIWSEAFKISWIDATITDIIIDGSDNVKFLWEKWFFSWSKEIWKQAFISWIQDLILKWKYEFNYNEGKTIKIEKV